MTHTKFKINLIKQTHRIIYILLLLILFTPNMWADFDDTGVGARPMGMGNSFISLADDVYAVYYNPAGLGWLKRAEFATEYERLYMGLSDDSTIAGGFLGYVYPLKFYSHKQEKIQKSTHTVETVLIETKHNFGVLGIGWVHFGLVGVYEENIISLAWGNRWGDRLSYGLSAKMLMEKYTQDAYTRIDPVFEMGKKSSLSAFSADAGILYNAAPRIFAGLMIMDINQPNVGLKSTEKLPVSIKTGICYRDKLLRLPLDFISKDGDMRANCGVERWLFKKSFAIRGGTSLGSRNLRDITLGFSFDLSVFRVDYGFRYPFSGIEDTIGSHRISLVCRFGRVPADELEPGSVEAELVKLEKERRELKARLKDAVEMKEKIEQVLIEEALARVREKIKAVKYYPSAKKEETKMTPQDYQTHIVARGDTLKSIAEKYFGTNKKWLDIYNLNKDKIGRGGSLKKGTMILIPSGIAESEDTKKPKETVNRQQRPKKALSVKPAKQTEQSKTSTPDEEIIAPKKISKPLPQLKEKSSAPSSKQKRTHTVASGETIKSISEKYYGDASGWKNIYNANKTKIKMGRVIEGEVLDIP